MTEKKLKFQLLPDTFGVCKLDPARSLPHWAYQSDFFSITRTADELSIVCEESVIPEDTVCERGWRALKIAGILDFSLVGILAAVSAVLAKAGVSIFAVSTYNTDYILVKEKDLPNALQSLGNEGFTLVFS